MTKAEAFKKLEMTVGEYLLSGQADDTTCGEWREILETLKQEPCEVTEADRDHIWYKGWQYISLRRFFEVKKEQEPCEDAISRKAVITEIKKWWRTALDAEGSPLICETIKKMPSVTPTREHGEWRETGERILSFRGILLYECQCSKCNGLAYFRKDSLDHNLVGAEWCPCCGADMRKEQSRW